MESLTAKYHLHPIIDHFTIALLAVGVLADVAGYAIIRSPFTQVPRVKALAQRLSGAVLVLLVPGATAAVLSRLTGEEEAGRVWNAISPVAQQVLFSDTGSGWAVSHAVLGIFLMYAFLALTTWRVLLEFWTKFRATQFAYMAVAIIALCALLYQGRTGGELVYNYGVGTKTAEPNSSSR